MADVTRGDFLATVDSDWRERCRTGELARRARQPTAESALPALVADALFPREGIELDVAGAVGDHIGDRLSLEEALMQVSLLNDSCIDVLGDEVARIRLLAGVVPKVLEEVARTYVARSEASARRDALTDLLNRKALDDDFGRAVERAERGELSVVLVNIDLNGLKAVNSQLGHPGGDRFLQHAAELFDRVAREASGQAYRSGGDEFILIFRGCSKDEVEAALTKMTELSECPPVSFGLAVAPDDVAEANLQFGDDELAERLSHLADSRMYETKVGTVEARQELTKEWLSKNEI